MQPSLIGLLRDSDVYCMYVIISDVTLLLLINGDFVAGCDRTRNLFYIIVYWGLKQIEL